MARPSACRLEAVDPRLRFGTGHPRILRDMIADDASVRERGWNAFYGALNHQGDYYGSTVATIPFLVEAVAHRGTPDRAHILHYLRERWLEAGDYAGDPLLPEPPGGTDIPAPVAPQGPRLQSPIESCPVRRGSTTTPIGAWTCALGRPHVRSRPAGRCSSGSLARQTGTSQRQPQRSFCYGRNRVRRASAC